MPAEQVVRAWAADLSRGDLDAAAGRFALPTVVRDGGGETRLVTRPAVRFFNEQLPCGAQVIGIRRLPGVLIADFRLTMRPGADCGAGVGGTASTAFTVREGLITSWARVPDRFVPRESRDSAGGGLRHRSNVP